MPNGYGPAMRIFIKISKIPFSILRKKGFLSIVYVDDSYLQGKDCFSSFLNTMKILRSLEFEIHPDNFITHLFILNSFQITITLTLKKKEIILSLCQGN